MTFELTTMKPNEKVLLSPKEEAKKKKKEKKKEKEGSIMRREK